MFVSDRGQGPDGLRLGLTVSRKKGPAVVRNRIKRVVREFFRIYQNEFRGRTDIVFVPKKSLDGRRINYALAEKELLPVIGKINCDLKPSAQQ